MKIAFNPSTVAALIAPPNNKDITFDLRGQNIFARGVKFCGTDTNTWRDIKINNVSIGSNTLDLRDSDNTTLTNINGVVTINSTWRPVVDNLTSDSTTSSLSANLGKVLAGLISMLSTNISNLYALRDGSNATGRWRGGLTCLDVRDTNYTPHDLNMGLELHFFDNNTNNLKDGGYYNGVFSFRQWSSGSDWSGGKAHLLSFTDNGNIWHRTSSKDDSWGSWIKLLDIGNSYVTGGKGVINGTTITLVDNADTVDGYHASKFPYINNNGIWRIYGNAAVAALTDNTAGLSSWAFGESRDYKITYLGILKPSTGTCGISAYGTIAVFGQGDTHLGIASDYGLANLQVFGGNADKIVWRKKVAFTDSNVASATKLQTPRTIWGQSFDGTRNISGSISGTYFHIEDRASNPYFKFIDSSNQIGYFQLLSQNKGVAIGSTESKSLIVNPSGDVSIGYSSPSYKLDVNGLMRSDGFHHFSVNSDNYILLAGGGYMNYKTGTTYWSTAILFGKYVWLTILMYNTLSEAQVVPSNISKPTKDIYVYGAASDRGISIWRISTDGIIYLKEGTSSVTHLYTTICYVAS